MSFFARSGSFSTSRVYLGDSGIHHLMRIANAGGTAPMPTIHRHILSTASTQGPAHVTAVASSGRDFRKEVTTIMATTFARRAPMGCMKKTTDSILSRCLRGANLVMVNARPGRTFCNERNLLRCDDSTQGIVTA